MKDRPLLFMCLPLCPYFIIPLHKDHKISFFQNELNSLMNVCPEVPVVSTLLSIRTQSFDLMLHLMEIRLNKFAWNIPFTPCSF